MDGSHGIHEAMQKIQQIYTFLLKLSFFQTTEILSRFCKMTLGTAFCASNLRRVWTRF